MWEHTKQKVSDWTSGSGAMFKKKKRRRFYDCVPANTAKASMDSKVVEQLLPPAGSPRSLILWVLGKGMRVKTIAKDLCKNSKFYFVFLSK